MPAFKKVNKGVQVTKCTPETIEKIANNLRLGMYLESAVVLADVGKETFYKWIRLSHKEPDSIYATLRVTVEKAVEEATARDLMNIDKAAMGSEPVYMTDKDGGIVYSKSGKPIVLKPGAGADWAASAWRLERRKPQEWGRTQKVELTGKDGAPVETTEETPEEREARKKRIQEKIDLVLALKQADGK